MTFEDKLTDAATAVLAGVVCVTVADLAAHVALGASLSHQLKVEAAVFVCGWASGAFYVKDQLDRRP